MRTAEWTESVSVLDRVTAVLEAFGEHDEGVGVSELARRANLPKSTVSRVATELVAQGFLDRVGDKLYLGAHLFELGRSVERPRTLRRLALPVMTRLRDLTGASVHLAVLEGASVVVVAAVRARPAPEPQMRVGARLPAHATALGKALLAFSPPAAVDAVIAGLLPRCSPRTICDSEVLLRDLTEIRRSRVATEIEEYEKGFTSAASPVVDQTLLANAAIGVTGPSDEIDPGVIGPALHGAAISLGRRLGGRAA